MKDLRLQMLIEAQNKASKEIEKVKDDLRDISAEMKRTQKEAKKATRDFKKMGSSISAVGKNLSVKFTLPIVAAGGAMVKMASDAEETQNRFNAVFGDLSDDANKFATDLGDAVGRSTKDIQDGLASFQGFAVGMGLGAEEASKMAYELQKLSIDFASFNNLSDEQSMQRFISAMGGSGQVLDTFGINIKAASLDLKLLEMGFPKVAQGATEAQKAMARFEIIEETMGKQGAIGDAIKTSDQFANQMRALKADVTDLSIEVGRELMPVARELLASLRGLLKWIKSLSPELKLSIAKWAALAAAIGPVVIVVGSLTKALGLVSGALKVVTVGMSATPMGLMAAAIALIIVKWEDVKKFIDMSIDSLKAFQELNKVKAGFAEEFADDIEKTKNAFIGLNEVRKNAAGAEQEFLDQLTRVVQQSNGQYQALARADSKAYEAIGESKKKNIENLRNWYQENKNNLNLSEEAYAAMNMTVTNELLKVDEELVKTANQNYALAEATKESTKKIADNVSSIPKVMEGVTNSITKTVVNTSDNALVWGKHLLENFTAGIRQKYPELNTAVKGAMNIVKAMKFSKNKLLPTEIWGQHAMENFGDGMKIGSVRIEEATADVTQILNDFGEEASEHAENLADKWNTLGREVQDLNVIAGDGLTDLARTHKEKMSDMARSTSDLRGELKDLWETYQTDVSNANKGLAEAYVDQEEKIASLKNRINQTDDRDAKKTLKKELDRELEALQAFGDRASGLEGEISEARKVAQMTDFERTVYLADKRTEKQTIEFQKRADMILDEMNLIKEQKDAEILAYEEKISQYQLTKDAFLSLQGTFVKGLDVMAATATVKVNEINNKVKSLRDSLNNLGDGQSSPLLTDSSMINGANLAPSGQGGDNNNVSNVSIDRLIGSVTVQNEADEDRLVNKIEEALTRRIQLNSVGSI